MLYYPSDKMTKILLLLLSTLIISFFSGCLSSFISPVGCEFIPDNFRKDQCFLATAAIKEDPKYCEMIEGKDSISNVNIKKHECYFVIAEKKKDHTFCEKISEDVGIGYTRNDCYLNLAIKMNNTDICYLIKDERQTKCFEGTGYLFIDERALKEEEVVGIVKAVTGNAIIKFSNSTKWIKVKAGLKLTKNDVIRVTEKSSVIIKLTQSGIEKEKELIENTEYLVD
ncbi:MAG: hypothetical protein N3E37_04855 [Candidatus Micrarchaeota archaeon]|nr:hypothetical protein [Candidatus Micrarchaeota archaeon]